MRIFVGSYGVFIHGNRKKMAGKWKAGQVYQVSNNSPKPKYYVLDMFPYPSGTACM